MLGGILWKQTVTAKVFLVGTRACGFLTKVHLDALSTQSISSAYRARLEDLKSNSSSNECARLLLEASCRLHA
jgi:hypothetical protein